MQSAAVCLEWPGEHDGRGMLDKDALEWNSPVKWWKDKDAAKHSDSDIISVWENIRACSYIET